MTEEQISLLEKQGQKLVNRLFSHAYVYNVHIFIRILNDELVFVPTYFIEKDSALHNLTIIDRHQTSIKLNNRLRKVLDYLGVSFDIRNDLTYYRTS